MILREGAVGEARFPYTEREATWISHLSGLMAGALQQFFPNERATENNQKRKDLLERQLRKIEGAARLILHSVGQRGVRRKRGDTSKVHSRTIKAGRNATLENMAGKRRIARRRLKNLLEKTTRWIAESKKLKNQEDLVFYATQFANEVAKIYETFEHGYLGRRDCTSAFDSV